MVALTIQSPFNGLEHQQQGGRKARLQPRPRTTLGVIVLNFTPSYFTVSMGTGIISQLLLTLPHQFHGQHYIALAFYFLNLFLLTAFFLLSIARYIWFPWVIWRMLKHPQMSLFLGCIPMALCTVINGTALIAVPKFGHWAAVLVQVLWWVDVALTLACSFGVPMLIFHIHHVELHSMTALVLLPIVPTVVAAASGGVIAPYIGASAARAVLVVSYMLWGINLGLSSMVLVLYFHRLAVHSLPNVEVITTALLPLGPLGQGTFAIVQLAKAGRQVHGAAAFDGPQAADAIWDVSILAGLTLWGLGLWWFVHGISSVAIRVVSSHGMGFSIGFWGFIFPLGVWLAGANALGDALPSEAFKWVAIVGTILLIILWLGVAYGTVKHGVQGRLLMAPCLTTAPTEDKSWVSSEASELH